jgi:hypothetical protein
LTISIEISDRQSLPTDLIDKLSTDLINNLAPKSTPRGYPDSLAPASSRSTASKKLVLADRSRLRDSSERDIPAEWTCRTRHGFTCYALSTDLLVSHWTRIYWFFAVDTDLLGFGSRNGLTGCRGSKRKKRFFGVQADKETITVRTLLQLLQLQAKPSQEPIQRLLNLQLQRRRCCKLERF